MEQDKLEELTFDLNKELLGNFAQDLQITVEELYNLLKLASKHKKIIEMAEQLNVVFKKNPKAHINFGEYGKKLAKEIKVPEDQMYQAIMVSSFNDLLLGMVKNLHANLK